MARDRGLERLFQLSRVARGVDRGLQRDILRGLRRALEPVVVDAKARYRGLGGTGPREARTVRASATAKTVELSAGGTTTWGAREFGADRRSTRLHQWDNQFGKGISFQGVKRIDYSSDRMFGRHTGTTGRAFVPAVRRGLSRANREADRLARDMIDDLAR